MSQCWCIIINSSPYFYSDFFSFYQMSFYFSQNPIQVPHDIYLSCLLRLPLAVILAQTFLYSDDLDSFEDGLVGIFVTCPCIEIYLLLSYDENRICGLGEKITEVKYYSHHVTSRALAVTRICRQWPHPWLRGEGYLSGFSSVTLLALSFCPVPLGASAPVQSFPWGVMFPPWAQSVYVNSFQISCRWDLSLLFLYLCKPSFFIPVCSRGYLFYILGCNPKPL